jgi:hypothetical protein
MKKVIKAGDPIPKFYGVSSRKMDRSSYVVWLIPFNIPAAIGSRLITYLKYGHKLYDHGYNQGYEKGQEMGYSDAYRDRTKELGGNE